MATAAYSLGTYSFRPEEFLPLKLFEAITEVRVNNPEMIFAEATCRRRRSRLTLDGKLVVLATDHPGRRVTNLPGDPLGMGDRHSYLARRPAGAHHARLRWDHGNDRFHGGPVDRRTRWCGNRAAPR